MTTDICHESDGAVVQYDEMTYAAPTCSMKPAFSIDYASIAWPAYKQVLLTGRNERPPEAAISLTSFLISA